MRLSLFLSTTVHHLTLALTSTDEPVFGGHLAALCAIEGSTVPRFVVECVSAIEAKPEHMKMDGVYRASGNLSQMQRIRCEVGLTATDVEEMDWMVERMDWWDRAHWEM